MKNKESSRGINSNGNELFRVDFVLLGLSIMDDPIITSESHFLGPEDPVISYV